jgi:hypothetical protein
LKLFGEKWKHWALQKPMLLMLSNGHDLIELLLVHDAE